MNTKHTPGPWEFSGPHSVVNADTTAYSVFAHLSDSMGSMEVSVASVIFMPGEDDNEQCEADARLIAAAPELLAACLRVINPTDEGPRMEDIVRAAIAKATGETA